MDIKAILNDPELIVDVTMAIQEHDAEDIYDKRGRDMNKLLIATYVLALRRVENNMVLASANNALSGFGNINSTVTAYGPFLAAGYITEDGNTADKDSLLEALSIVINERLDTETFV